MTPEPPRLDSSYTDHNSWVHILPVRTAQRLYCMPKAASVGGQRCNVATAGLGYLKVSQDDHDQCSMRVYYVI
jgi:hypothetical protein